MDSHGDWKAKGPLLELGSHAAVAGVGKESDCWKTKTAGWPRLKSTKESHTTTRLYTEGLNP